MVAARTAPGYVHPATSTSSGSKTRAGFRPGSGVPTATKVNTSSRPGSRPQSRGSFTGGYGVSTTATAAATGHGAAAVPPVTGT